MNIKHLAVIAACFAAGGTAFGQAELDTFNTEQFVEVSNAPLAFSVDATAAPEVLGGERDIYVHRVTGSLAGDLYGDVNLTIPNGATLSTGPGVIGSMHIVYDGADGNGGIDAINYTGLGGLDLSEAGAYDSFTFSAASDLGVSVTIRVYSDAQNYSEITLAVPADSNFTLTDFTVPFADFAQAGAGPADFANVGAVEVEFGDGPAAADSVFMGFSRTGSPTPPPPPPGDDEAEDCCPKSQGYWKNHANLWPVESLVLGATSYTKSELLCKFRTPPSGNASIILTHQLIAAKLNVADCAGEPPAAILDAIALADTLLLQAAANRDRCSSDYAALRQQLIDAAATLETWNTSCPDAKEGSGCTSKPGKWFGLWSHCVKSCAEIKRNFLQACDRDGRSHGGKGKNGKGGKGGRGC